MSWYSELDKKAGGRLPFSYSPEEVQMQKQREALRRQYPEGLPKPEPQQQWRPMPQFGSNPTGIPHLGDRKNPTGIPQLRGIGSILGSRRVR